MNVLRKIFSLFHDKYYQKHLLTTTVNRTNKIIIIILLKTFRKSLSIYFPFVLFFHLMNSAFLLSLIFFSPPLAIIRPGKWKWVNFNSLCFLPFSFSIPFKPSHFYLSRLRWSPRDKFKRHRTAYHKFMPNKFLQTLAFNLTFDDLQVLRLRDKKFSVFRWWADPLCLLSFLLLCVANSNKNRLKLQRHEKSFPFKVCPDRSEAFSIAIDQHWRA